MKHYFLLLLLFSCARAVEDPTDRTTRSTEVKPDVTSAPARSHSSDTSTLTFDGEQNGCGRFQLYAADKVRLNFVVLTIDPELRIPPAGRTFDLAVPLSGLSLYLDRYASPVVDENYCTDVPQLVRVDRWSATAGRLHIRHDGKAYVWAELDGLVFRSPEGKRSAACETVRFDSVKMMWWIDER